MRLPQTVNNWLSYLGLAIAGLATAAFAVVLIVYLATGGSQPYAGLVLFILIPAVVLVGLLLVPVGMVVEWRHQKRTGLRSIPRLPRIDLNVATHRNAVILFAVGTVFVALLAAVVSVEAFDYTESPVFCGQLCHSVMQPEYVTYEESPHARVACVDCHVGPGASWYVRSKLAGVHQVVATLTGRYPRPIPSPIENLRPAQETCLGCHWPAQFWGDAQVDLLHFLPDSANSPWKISLSVKIGGGNPQSGPARGIHWHMSIDGRVQYYATDSARQRIAWVRYTDRETGRPVEYVAAGVNLDPDTLPDGAIRTMDCIDCHNRPTHIMQSPSRSLDLALAEGSVDTALPYVKRTAVRLLSAPYPSTDSAITAIDHGMRDFYAEHYPAIASSRTAAIAAATAAVQGIYRRNDFPTMKARWDVYPRNNQHLTFPGCFRCHDDRHVSADGRVITRQCTTCHTILSQGPPAAMEYAQTADGLAFRHPVDIGGAWRQLACEQCHRRSGAP